jgi:hypothetical protein
MPIIPERPKTIKGRGGKIPTLSNPPANGHTKVESPEGDTGSWAELAEQNAKVLWLLKDWVPYGLLTGLVGQPKVAKSLFALWALVRPVITGGGWFTGQKGGDAGNVVWCDTEHRAAVNLERAVKWGLPVGKIRTPFKDVRQAFHMGDPDHVNRLIDVVSRSRAKLVVVDSFRGAHALDENNSQIGVLLQALAGVSEETKAAVVVIHHTKKLSVGEDLTINCGRGSNAFLAAVVMQIAIDIPDSRPNLRDARRRVQVLGENLGSAPTPQGFRITDGGLRFGEAPTRPQMERKETGKDLAERWLTDRLNPGKWYSALEVIAEGTALGFSRTGTLERAKKALKVETRKAGKAWEWRREEITDGPENG